MLAWGQGLPCLRTLQVAWLVQSLVCVLIHAADSCRLPYSCFRFVRGGEARQGFLFEWAVEGCLRLHCGLGGGNMAKKVAVRLQRWQQGYERG